MNEIFDIRRFGALTAKFYRENMKTNLIFIAVMMVVTFLCVCKFNPFQREYFMLSDAGDILARYQRLYAFVCWGLFGLFSVFVASRAFIEVMSRSRATTALLLPASSFEKYLLVVIHSTVVVLLVHLVIFYGMAMIASSYKYVGIDVGIEEADFTKGVLFGNQQVLGPGQKVVYLEVGNVFTAASRYLFDRFSSPALQCNLLAALWTSVVGVFIWGSITFRKRSVLLTILVHALAFLLIGGLAFLFVIFNLKSVDRSESMLYDLFFWGTKIDPFRNIPSWWWQVSHYIFPLTYFTVIWYKFKNKQV